MFKLINLIICLILINYGQSKKLSSLYIDDLEYEKVSIDRYHQLKSKTSAFKDDHFNRFKIDGDLQASASSNELDVVPAPSSEQPSRQDERFSKWYDISEHSANQTLQQPSIKLESNLSNLNSLISSNQLVSKPTKKKKWRLVSSSTLSDTSIDDDNGGFAGKRKAAHRNKINWDDDRTKLDKKQKMRKSRKLKTANLELKLKETANEGDYVRNKVANTTVYTLNRKENDLKFRLNDAIGFGKANYQSSRIRSNLAPNQSNSTALSLPLARSNDTLTRRTQLTGESKISKKIMLATMLPSMIKGLSQAHAHVAVLPTAIAQPVAQPILMPQPVPVPIAVPQVHIVAQPRPVYHQVVRPAQIVTQPIIQQPIIQQPIIQQPVVHRKIITQPIIVQRPVHVIRTVQPPPQPVYQTVHVAAQQPCDSGQDVVDDSGEEATIGDPVDDEDNTSAQADDSFSQNPWGSGHQQEQQVQIVPQPVAQQPDSWGNHNVQNQRIYSYHTASVPKSTRTVYTHTKMIPSITTVHSTTSYTPEHKHTVVETDHNVKPVMSLVSTSHRRIVSRPVYTVKAIKQPVQVQTVSPSYVSNNQGYVNNNQGYSNNNQGSWSHGSN